MLVKGYRAPPCSMNKPRDPTHSTTTVVTIILLTEICYQRLTAGVLSRNGGYSHFAMYIISQNITLHTLGVQFFKQARHKRLHKVSFMQSHRRGKTMVTESRPHVTTQQTMPLNGCNLLYINYTSASFGFVFVFLNSCIESTFPYLSDWQKPHSWTTLSVNLWGDSTHIAGGHKRGPSQQNYLCFTFGHSCLTLRSLS